MNCDKQRHNTSVGSTDNNAFGNGKVVYNDTIV